MINEQQRNLTKAWTKHQILSEEISAKYVTKIKQFMKGAQPDDYAFSSFFDGQWRVAVPLTYDESAFEEDLILNRIRRYALHGGWTNIDLNTKTLSKIEKQTNPKTGETVDRKVEMKLGKWLTRIVKNPPDFISSYDAERLLQNYNVLQGQIGTRWIIFSRHPIDVLRMSDFENIQSCHSQGGAYFHCAIQEAQGHGLIAYVVSASEYAKVKDRLQDEEIFADKPWEPTHRRAEPREARNIEGAAPLARMRAKEFYNSKLNISIALPEKKAYGTPVFGFAKTFERWIREKQDAHLPEKIIPNDYELAGGYYADYGTYYEFFEKYFGSEKMSETSIDATSLEEMRKLVEDFNKQSDFVQMLLQEESTSPDYWHDTLGGTDDIGAAPSGGRDPLVKRQVTGRNSVYVLTVFVPRDYENMLLKTIPDNYRMDLETTFSALARLQGLSEPNSFASSRLFLKRAFGSVVLEKLLGAFRKTHIQDRLSLDLDFEGTDYRDSVDSFQLTLQYTLQDLTIQKIQKTIEELRFWHLTSRKEFESRLAAYLRRIGALTKRKFDVEDVGLHNKLWIARQFPYIKKLKGHFYHEMIAKVGVQDTDWAKLNLEKMERILTVEFRKDVMVLASGLNGKPERYERQLLARLFNIRLLYNKKANTLGATYQLNVKMLKDIPTEYRYNLLHALTSMEFSDMILEKTQLQLSIANHMTKMLSTKTLSGEV